MLKQGVRRGHCAGQQQRKISKEPTKKKWPPGGEVHDPGSEPNEEETLQSDSVYIVMMKSQ